MNGEKRVALWDPEMVEKDFVSGGAGGHTERSSGSRSKARLFLVAGHPRSVIQALDPGPSLTPRPVASALSSYYKVCAPSRDAVNPSYVDS